MEAVLDRSALYLNIELDPSIQFYVYVLECYSGEYYVGYSGSLLNRLEKHFTGKGAVFTQTYPPVDIIKVIPIGNDRDQAVQAESLERRYLVSLGLHDGRNNH